MKPDRSPIVEVYIEITTINDHYSKAADALEVDHKGFKPITCSLKSYNTAVCNQHE
jgi:hypothetical protein